MADKKPPSPSVLRQLIDYDPETGALVWRVRDVSFFTDGEKPAIAVMNAWNSRLAGKPALKSKGFNGYFNGSIFGKTYLAHRVAWAIHSGAWPEREIDHINGDRSDNRISNLRSVTSKENSENMAIRSDNKSGAVGVCWNARRSRWVAQVSINGKQKHIGYFKSKDEATQARAKASAEYGYHGRKP